MINDLGSFYHIIYVNDTCCNKQQILNRSVTFEKFLFLSWRDNIPSPTCNLTLR